MSLDEMMKEHMDAVRSLGNVEGTKMSINDATKVLQAFKLLKDNPIHDRFNDDNPFDINTITQTEIDFVRKNGGMSASQSHVPVDGKWWYVITLVLSTTNMLQFALPDTGDALYSRIKASSWNSWNKLGGVIKSLLCAVRQHFSPSLIGGVA